MSVEKVNVTAALIGGFAKTFDALFDCRVTLRDSTLSSKEKLRRIEKYLCDLDKGISSIFHITKGDSNTMT